MADDRVEDWPPGTVSLVQYREARETSGVVLSPAPSNDPNDPLNWSPSRKYVNYGIIMAMAVAVFTNLMVQTVFWQQMAVDLNVTFAQLSNAQSANLAGLAMGCIFFIPFTIKYGRRPTYILSTAVLAAVTWWMARMNTYAELIVTSVISGLAGAINETAVQMTIADMFFVHQRGTANGLYFVAVMVGSFLTPIGAGSQAATQGWRWSYTALAIAMTILFLVFVLLYEETKYIPTTVGRSAALAASSAGSDKDNIPEKLGHDNSTESRTKQLQELQLVATNSNPASHYRMASYRQRMRLTTPTGESLRKVFVLPLYIIALPHVFFTALQFASVVCWLVLFMGVVSVVFSAPPYNFDTAGIGYMTLGPFVGNVFGSIYGGPFSDWLALRLAARNKGVYEPEMRLYPLLLPLVFMAGGLVMFGITADRGMHWIYPSIGGAFFAFGLGATGDIAFTLVIDTYRHLTAEAFVGVAFLRNAVSVGVPSALVPWLTAMGLSKMYILSGCLALAIGLLHVPMIIWGKRIRIALAPRYYALLEKHMNV